MRKVAGSGRAYRVPGRVAATAMACCSTWTCHPVLARVLGFNCAVHLTGIYSQAVQAVRLVAIRLSRSPIIMTHFVAVAQRTANSRGSLPIPWMTCHVPCPASHVRRPTHPAAGCSIFACLLFRLRHFDFLICLVAFCIHLPLHFICQHCITLSGISSGCPRPLPLLPFGARTCRTLDYCRTSNGSAKLSAGENQKFCASMCGRGRWLEWACQSDKREPEIVSRTQRPDLPRSPPLTSSWRQIREIIAEKENSAANIV